MQWTPDLLKVLYVQHLHQGVDCQSLQDGVDSGRAHICADVLLQAQHAPLGLKLRAVAANHVHETPEGLRLQGKVQKGLDTQNLPMRRLLLAKFSFIGGNTYKDVRELCWLQTKTGGCWVMWAGSFQILAV